MSRVAIDDHAFVTFCVTVWLGRRVTDDAAGDLAAELGELLEGPVKPIIESLLIAYSFPKSTTVEIDLLADVDPPVCAKSRR